MRARRVCNQPLSDLLNVRPGQPCYTSCPIRLRSTAPTGRLARRCGGGFIAERSFRATERTRVNERIRAREVRVIDDDGGQLGLMQPFEAMRVARERGLDLVEISPNADPPVCKITDYGKFLYQANKKAHEQRKHQKGTQLKEVKFRPATAEHDYQVRKNQIIKFLGDGHKVKAMIFHRGREMAHQEVGRAKMERLLKDIADHALVELGPRMEANILMALLAPKKGGAVAPRPSAAAGSA
jgi:translation initiation factor IF-3